MNGNEKQAMNCATVTVVIVVFYSKSYVTIYEVIDFPDENKSFKSSKNVVTNEPMQTGFFLSLPSVILVQTLQNSKPMDMLTAELHK